MTLTTVDIGDKNRVMAYAKREHNMTMKQYLNILIRMDMKRDLISSYYKRECDGV